jgi:predicted Fe-Mo cluster-binding NifX family protein
VEAVLTGHIGRKAAAVLHAANIRIFLGASGRVGEALEKFKAGQYSEA